MKWNEVFCHTFKVLKKEIEPAVKKQVDFQKKNPDCRTKSDSTLPECSTFVLVKASEPRYGTLDPCRRHLRGVPTSSTTRSDDTLGG